MLSGNTEDEMENWRVRYGHEACWCSVGWWWEGSFKLEERHWTGENAHSSSLESLFALKLRFYLNCFLDFE